jgi:hypothetical protein
MPVTRLDSCHGRVGPVRNGAIPHSLFFSSRTSLKVIKHGDSTTQDREPVSDGYIVQLYCG